jgi:urea transport system permease protein
MIDGASTVGLKEAKGTAAPTSTLFSVGRFALFAFFLACLYVPAFFFDPHYRLPQFNRFLALALFALSVDLIWGYTGLLSLGQGLYYGLGGYFVAYSLKLQRAATNAELGRYDWGPDMAMPDYMFQGQLNHVPLLIQPLINIYLALFLAVLVPTLIATLFGWIVFRRRIQGVYFSLITQALVYAFFTLVSTQRSYTGGVDGQPNLENLEVFGFEFKNYFHLNLVIVTLLCLFAIVSYFLIQSKFGKILTAIRDNEYRVLALGYDTAMYKTLVFAFAGMMAAVAGALSVCSTKSAGPQFFSIEESILVVIYVAVGGRGTLVGPILGALLVSVGQDRINSEFTRAWPIILGCLFIGVVLLLPDGIVGGLLKLVKLVLPNKNAPTAQT